MRILSYQLLGILLVFKTFSIFAQDAPVSTIGSFESTGFSVSIPITATGINNIGSCNLQLLYDPAIVTCSSVVKGSQLGGGLATNLNVPGVITLGWYTWPGITLPDNTEIFILNFSKVSEGTSIITWNNDYPDRQWSDGNSLTLNDQPMESFYFNGSLSFEEDAPVTTVATLTTCSGSSFDVPVTVANFNTIGAISLILQYDANVLTYQSFTNNSGFPGLFVNNPSAGFITASGFSTDAGITLTDGAILFTLHFDNPEGSSAFSWFDDGVSCEYTGPPPTYNVLNDIPQELFYIDGSITVAFAPVITNQPVSPDTVNPGSGTAIFSVGATGSELNYQWQEFAFDFWSDLENAGVYSGVFTSELFIVDPPITMNGYQYRCIVSGFCEPPAITDGTATLTVAEYSGFDSDFLNNNIYLISFPNPFKDEVEINFALPSLANVSIDLMDLFGITKMTLTDSIKTAGDYSEKFKTDLLSPGLYFIRISLNTNEKQMVRLIKIIKQE